jgi:RNA polymerase sigma factor (sigma-70 family)
MGFENSESFDRVLSMLPFRELECMQLRLEGMRYDEIARILGIKPGTVASLLSRSLKRIRESRTALDK